MTTKKNIAIEEVLAKLGLSEKETEVLMNHFVEKYLQEKCNLSVNVSMDTSYECDNRYVTLNAEVELTNENGVILSSNTYTSTSI